MSRFTDDQLADFNRVLPWTQALRLPDGRILGTPTADRNVSDGNDYLIETLASRVDLHGKSVLEIGALEGYYTVQLAKRCRHVVALEVRPQNVCRLLTRLFAHDVTNVRCVVGDARDLDRSHGRYDVIFHSGVLYHLDDPVTHLFRIREMTDELFLDTHYSPRDTDFVRSDITHAGKSYQAHIYHETARLWEDPWAGVDPVSRWLERETLLELLAEVGFTDVTVLSDRIETGRERFTIHARRHRTPLNRVVRAVRHSLGRAKRGVLGLLSRGKQPI